MRMSSLLPSPSLVLSLSLLSSFQRKASGLIATLVRHQIHSVLDKASSSVREAIPSRLLFRLCCHLSAVELLLGSQWGLITFAACVSEWIKATIMGKTKAKIYYSSRT